MKRSEFLSILDYVLCNEVLHPHMEENGMWDTNQVAKLILEILDKHHIAPSKYYSGNGWEAEND